MKEKYISILYCTQQQLNNITEFAYKVNINREHASTFCAKSKSAIREDFSEGISKNCVLACWNDDEIIGILNCFIDQAKNNADCTILINSQKCDYNTVVFSPMKNVNKLTVLPVRKLMDIMTITS